MNAERIIKAAISNADEALISQIIWERTCYPFGSVTPKTLYKAASRFNRANKNKIRLCDMCDNKAISDEWLCSSCDTALAKHRELTN